ncbi:TetR/AcrR family transcriptional regulator [Beggiatoa leptomitoformis]|uniref:TetR family transcriptional regulator n=1 Tax=Beggiatoa leptomitoformis TaxID=288004 RepID=A0A2N9YFW9_9GAMM|nr:TetR/AcrR family transcriptional regulator [Beggiatoa leptomitoformis]ALG68281.1 TetR family transcriptional regulator [Beggiatoa leptomitoformis]AUI69408.1 TetR family transcriptional regulator [Beggiatoa leptomitoformis]
MDDKRCLILDATRQLIVNHGLHGTSMNMIVKASGVPMGTIYRYFKDKETLINELHRELIGHIAKVICKGLNETESLRQQLEQLINNIIDCNEVYPDRFLTKAILDMVPRPEDEEKALLEKIFQPVLSFALRGIEQGVFKPLPVDVLLSLGLGPVEWHFHVHKRNLHGLTPKQRALFIQACWDAMTLEDKR